MILKKEKKIPSHAPSYFDQNVNQFTHQDFSCNQPERKTDKQYRKLGKNQVSYINFNGHAILIFF